MWDGAYRVIGYIEAKLPDTDLDRIEKSDQLRRYCETFPNLLLTDFYEFRLYREGAQFMQVQIAYPTIARKVRECPPVQNLDRFLELIETFLSYRQPPLFTAEALAQALARRTRFLREEVFLPELKEKQKVLYGFYKAFQEYLVIGLKEEEFADLYAQTLTYGLFAARMRAQGEFSRQQAIELIPPTIGILRDIFHYISLGQPSPQMKSIIDDIAAVLSAANVQAILESYKAQGRSEDPIIHFYETFLAEYDPQTREQRGVYYTPQPVVQYIVRSVHALLRERFGYTYGIAHVVEKPGDPAPVKVLDPAAGTCTFLVEAIRLAILTHIEAFGEGLKETIVRKHILPNFYGFELLMAPYAIGHIKISLLLKDLGVPLQLSERFQLYLTNALDMTSVTRTELPGISALSEENHHAARIKKTEPILVILGNPPYSGHSANKGLWETELKTNYDGLQSYYEVNGQPLGEKNPKMLQDDYVKFLRFAQWKIHKAGRGIVAMITNHAYLDNPTFRGMRQSLLKTFDEIYILDLHGNSLKKETAPDGSRDENVFKIRVGVAIAFFVKYGQNAPSSFAGRGIGGGVQDAPSLPPESEGRVYHADLYGTRETKYAYLSTHDITTTRWQPITPTSPFYFFVPRQTQNLEAYRTWPSVLAIFPVNSTGVKTHRDSFAIAFDKAELQNRVVQLQNSHGMPDEILSSAYGLKDTGSWSLSAARKKVQADGDRALDKIYPILYRPFDVLYIFYHEAIVERPRYEVMRHLLVGQNLALVTTRQVKASKTWQHCFVSNRILECCLVSNYTSEIGYALPLYLYPDVASAGTLSGGRQANIDGRLLAAIGEAYGEEPAPEDVLAYVYAVLYSPTYRERYAAELRVDFPRVPFTREREVFWQMAALGRRLIALHLLDSPELDPPAIRYEGQGPDVVEQVRYDAAAQRVFINAHKYFTGVTPKMWAYQIGGYQVLEKYLKDRQGRTVADPVRYLYIGTAIARTMALQKEIDAVYPTIEARLLREKVI